MTTCTRCNRPLTDPQSIRKDWRGNEYCGPYDGGDIVLERRIRSFGSNYLLHGTAFINVPHAIVRHSPAGFEWGYGGSGPADAALNILLAVTGNREIAEQHYQQFKWEFIAPMPEEGGVIKRDEIIEWLRRNGCEVA